MIVQILFWLLRIVPTLINAYSTLLVVYALMTWLPNAMASPLGQLLHRIVDPYLNVFRRLIPSVGMVSFSVLFGILFLRLVERGVIIVLGYLIGLALQF